MVTLQLLPAAKYLKKTDFQYDVLKIRWGKSTSVNIDANTCTQFQLIWGKKK